MVRRQHVGVHTRVLPGVPHKGIVRGVWTEYLSTQPRVRNDDVVGQSVRD